VGLSTGPRTGAGVIYHIADLAGSWYVICTARVGDEELEGAGAFLLSDLTCNGHELKCLYISNTQHSNI
jgi:hypothetical protein